MSSDSRIYGRRSVKAKEISKYIADEILLEEKKKEFKQPKDHPSQGDIMHRNEQTNLGRALFLEGVELPDEQIRELGYYVLVGYNIEKRIALGNKLSEDYNKAKKGR